MMNHNPKPLGARKTVQLLVILTILAWATQTLLTQWGYGGLILPGGHSAAKPLTLPEPTLELRSDATIDGSQATLKEVCRWASEDDAVFAPIADTVLTRLSQSNPIHVVPVSEIRTALHDAGANLSQIKFSGAATCAVRRSEVDDATFARLLSHMNDGDEDIAGADGAPTTKPSDAESIVADAPQTPLQDLLTTDLIDRLKLSGDRVQITFDGRDQPTLILTSPRCRFDIDSSRATALGTVAWDVLIRTDTAERRITLTAKALAWEDQTVLTRPLSKGQEVLAQDVTSRKMLVEKLDEQSVNDALALVGQLLTKDMKRGDVLTLADVKPAPLVFKDQPVTVALSIQGQTVETVARAMQTGAKGESIQARNEANGEVYDVVVTGRGEAQSKLRQAKIASADDGSER